MTTTSEHLSAAATEVSAYFGQAIDELERWAEVLADDLARALAAGPITTDQLDRLVEPAAIATFDALALPVYGAGFIAAVDSLADARSHLAWWQGVDRAKLVLATQSVRKEQIDYSELEWFRVPRETGRAHVAGPYVDYLCSDEYTITVAIPVTVKGEFRGVAGLDLLIDQVERELTPRLAARGDDLSIVNGVGRLLLSSNRGRETGDTIRGPELEFFDRQRCEGIDLEVLSRR